MKTFLKIGDVMAATGLGDSIIYRWVREGVFPAPISLGPSRRATRWDSEEVEAWMAEQIAKRAEQGHPARRGRPRKVVAPPAKAKG